MITTEELFKDTSKYPTWIRTHHIFSYTPYIRKAFPELGLPNFEEKLAVDNTKEIVAFANQLLELIAVNATNRAAHLETFALKGKIGKKRRILLDQLVSMFHGLTTQLRDNRESFIVKLPTGKVSLNLPEDITNGDKQLFKKGMGLFKLYEKLNSVLKANKFVELADLTQAYQFKNFSSINIPSKETIVKFSAEGAEGAWDIATMSMRGVNSCQTWDAGIGNSGRIIGSMIDPFTGIIYLTKGDDHNHYGSKMMRRCVVRYAIDSRTSAPYLLLEKMYPAFDRPSLETFVTTLRKRAPNLTIHYSADIGEKASVAYTTLSYSYVPLSDELKRLDVGYRPYTDSGITFKEDNTLLARNTETVKGLFKRRMPNLLQETIKSKAFTQTKVKSYGKVPMQLVSQWRKLSKPVVATESTKPVKTPKYVLPEDKTIAKLGERFADVMITKSGFSNPAYQYLLNHKQDCLDFWKSEFPDNEKFADFMTNQIVSYLEQNQVS